MGLDRTCAQPGEERRTHQWSFKPSAATVLSHAAVFLPAASRYVGVQQGSTLVSWRESEQDVKRPLSSQVKYLRIFSRRNKHFTLTSAAATRLSCIVVYVRYVDGAAMCEANTLYSRCHLSVLG